MTDWFDMLIGALILSGGWSAGRTQGFLAGKRKYQNAPPEMPELECSCGEGYGTHDPMTGKCQGQRKRESKWDSYKDQHGTKKVKVIGWEYVQCPCLHYDGPKPIDSIISGWKPPQQLPPA